MDNKNFLIILAVVLICIIAGTVFLLSMDTVNYERIEISPDGATIDVPSNQLKDYGNTLGVRFWKWDNGAMMAYKSSDNNNTTGLAESLGFNAVKKLLGVGKVESIDGYEVYSISDSEIPDSFRMYVHGNIYAVNLVNETTHDNILICCKDKDVALHMAKSVQY